MAVAAREVEVEFVESDNCTTPVAEVELAGKYVELIVDPCQIPEIIVPTVELPVTLKVGIVTVPVKLGVAEGAFSDKAVVTVVENDASFPKAVASSFKVSKADGADATRLETSVLTNAVVAI